jgi:hypothetical protein
MIYLQTKIPNIMKKQDEHEFKLIDGQFYPNEAMNVLMSLFNSKIEYHQLESFSNQIRSGSDVSSSQNRIQSLKNSVESIKAIINEAEVNGKQLKIEGLIQVTFVD